MRARCGAVRGREAAAAIHQRVLDSTAGEHRFAILDSLPDRDLSATVTQWQQLAGANGALYYPWVIVSDLQGRLRASSRRAGTWRASSPEPTVKSACSRRRRTSRCRVCTISRRRFPTRATVRRPGRRRNCLRAFPSRGIRVWGARTTTGEAAWRDINVVRLFQTTARWMARNLVDVVMEPHDVWLCGRGFGAKLNDYLFKLFRQGALKGATPQEAYFLKCDDETTPTALRDLGQVVVEVGLAPIVPAEFIIVRSCTRGRITGGDARPDPAFREEKDNGNRRSQRSICAYFNFLVEIDGIARAGFRECSGLDSSNDVDRVPRRHRRPCVRKLPGMATTPTSRSSGALTDDLQLWEWREKAARRQGRAQERLDRPARRHRRREAALELRRRVADEMDRPDPQRRRQRGRDRDARDRPRRADQGMMLQTEFPFTLPHGYRRRRRARCTAKA